MPKGQYLRSFVAPESLFIDIMMNVPLIFYGAKETGDSELERIGLAHSRTTRDRLVRSDGSTAHEGIFELSTGNFLQQSTHQGWSPESAWARGLAWSMYGFSQVYGLTGNEEFLAVAERNADFWLTHLPKDRVPYWDFRADLSQPLPWGPQKDSSAGAIAASALLDLELQTKNEGLAVVYRTTAEAMLNALVEHKYPGHCHARLGGHSQARRLPHQKEPGGRRIGNVGRLLPGRGAGQGARTNGSRKTVDSDGSGPISPRLWRRVSLAVNCLTASSVKIPGLEHRRFCAVLVTTKGNTSHACSYYRGNRLYR